MRSLLSAVEQACADAPNDAWAYLPTQGAGGELSWTPMTWIELRAAVDRLADWIETQFGQAGKHDTIAYMASNDVRYPLMILASMQLGYRTLLVSPRNSTEGHSSLFSAVNCQKLLYSPGLRGLVDQLVARHDVSIAAIQPPEVSDLLCGSLNETPRAKHSSGLGEDDIVLILHSSGTTGLPKPIYFTLEALAVMDTITEMPCPPGRRNLHDELFQPTTMISMLPFFHIMGIATVLRTIYHRGPLALLPGGGPATAELMVDAINKVKPAAIACVPSILESMSATRQGMDALSIVDHVFYGGAPLAQSSGDKVSEVTTLLNAMGSTEMCNVPSYVPQDKADWEYFEWNPEYGSAIEDRRDGSFELVIKRKPNRMHQMIFHNFPHLSEWRTNDLFENHPVKPTLWRYIGRADEIMVLSNGEKVSPVLFEKTIEGQEGVKGALLAGSQRFQTCLLIEPVAEESCHDNGFLDQLWPVIDAANASLPSYAKVWRSMVILSEPNKPFLRSPKGTTRRQATWQLYEEEINRLYHNTEATAAVRDGNTTHSATEHTVESVKGEISQAVQSIMQISLADNDDFFRNGMDSLKALELHRQLLSAQHVGNLLSLGASLPLAAIYRNSSISRLAKYIFTLRLGNDANASPVRSREEIMSEMIYKHSKSFPPLSALNGGIGASKPATSHSVILTGSTGSLGTYILHNLLQQPQISQVFCLNRSSDASGRQNQAFRERGLDVSGLDARVVFLTVNLTEPHFGLSASEYEALKERAALIIHNAWPVNFNNDLEYFADAIRGTRRLIDLAITAPHKPRFVFVSSIASVGNFAAVRPDEWVIPEEMDEDNSLPLAQGYGESKHVVSCIMAKAARVSGLRGAIVRVGQLSGPDDGGAARWNQTEWLPSMVLTSKNLGKFPSSLGDHGAVDWVPVNKAAEILLELTMPGFKTSSCTRGEDQDAGLACYNLVNPQMGEWGDVVRAVQEYYGTRGRTIVTIDLSAWIEELEGMGASEDAVALYPALKLLDFYRAMSGQSGTVTMKFATRLGEEQSPVLAGLSRVDDRLIGLWLNGWEN